MNFTLSDDAKQNLMTVYTDAAALRPTTLNMVLAQYDFATDAVSFDWPLIEQAAGDKGNLHHPIAKVLLAARDAGRPVGFV